MQNKREIRKAKEMTDAFWGYVMLCIPNKDEIVEVVCEEKVALLP